MKVLLLYPPISDPTSGYHSLCYLESFARENGFEEIDIVDTNIESLHYSMTDREISATMELVKTRRRILEQRAYLNGYEQLELYHLWKSKSFEPSDLKTAVRILQSEQSFYNYGEYRWAVQTLTAWMDILSLRGYAGQFKDFSIPLRSYWNLFSSKDLSNPKVLERILAPFAPYFKDVLIPKINENKYKVIGINITYFAQLPFALEIARLIRSSFHDAVILFGGTTVSAIWKYLDSKDKFFSIFQHADACVVGEGESAFVALLSMIESGETMHSIPNVMINQNTHGIKTGSTAVRYENVAVLPTPDYTKLPWEKYLSPHSFIYYSPSRGCYWNKCTFCDYGLNFDSPTSPWRQYSVEKIISDLKILSMQYKYIYMSVDVLSPAMLLKLAERIIEERIDIRWGAEIRLEKYWDSARCAILKRSGCTAISVGFESGNQRILDLINKGVNIEGVGNTIRNFHEAGVGVQMMGFTGFPSETFEEAMDSVRFLKEHRQYWTLGGLGEFILTKGAIVAKKHVDFGIQDVKPMDGEDIAFQLYYTDSISHLSQDKQSMLLRAKEELDTAEFGRPWMGGVDTPHSMFYHDKFSGQIQAEFDSIQGGIDPYLCDDWVLNGSILEDLEFYRIDDLLNDTDFTVLHYKSVAHGRGLVSDDVSRILNQMTKYRRSDSLVTETARYFVRSDGRVFSLPSDVLSFLDTYFGKSTRDHILPEDTTVHDTIFKFCVEHNLLRERFLVASHV